MNKYVKYAVAAACGLLAQVSLAADVPFKIGLMSQYAGSIMAPSWTVSGVDMNLNIDGTSLSTVIVAKDGPLYMYEPATYIEIPASFGGKVIRDARYVKWHQGKSYECVAENVPVKVMNNIPGQGSSGAIPGPTHENSLLSESRRI